MDNITLFDWRDYENDVFIGGNKTWKDTPAYKNKLEYLRDLRKLKKSFQLEKQAQKLKP